MRLGDSENKPDMNVRVRFAAFPILFCLGVVFCENDVLSTVFGLLAFIDILSLVIGF